MPLACFAQFNDLSIFHVNLIQPQGLALFVFKGNTHNLRTQFVLSRKVQHNFMTMICLKLLDEWHVV